MEQFRVENEVVVFTLDLLVDEEQVDVLSVSVEELVLPGFRRLHRLLKASKPANRVAHGQDELVVGDLVKLAQPTSELKVGLLSLLVGS